MKNNYLKLEFLSLPENQAFARDAVAAFCLPLNPTLDMLSDVKTAVSEAVTNCTVHAYRGTAGIVTVECTTEGGVLHILIGDRGAGIPDVNAALQPFFTTLPSEERSGMGLLKAINGFDESFGVRFSTYAVPMIAGEIKRFMRDDGSIKVSRAIKAEARAINKYIEEYSAEHGCQPTVKQIAGHFSMSESQVVFTMGSSCMPVSLSSQGEYKDEKTGELSERLPAADGQDDMIEKLQLKAAIEGLEERDKKVIMLRYFRDMTQSEVAACLGVSQVQVSRIESRILSSFKKQLAN